MPFFDESNIPNYDENYSVDKKMFPVQLTKILWCIKHLKREIKGRHIQFKSPLFFITIVAQILTGKWRSRRKSCDIWPTKSSSCLSKMTKTADFFIYNTWKTTVWDYLTRKPLNDKWPDHQRQMIYTTKPFHILGNWNWSWESWKCHYDNYGWQSTCLRWIMKLT